MSSELALLTIFEKHFNSDRVAYHRQADHLGKTLEGILTEYRPELESARLKLEKEIFIAWDSMLSGSISRLADGRAIPSFNGEKINQAMKYLRLRLRPVFVCNYSDEERKITDVSVAKCEDKNLDYIHDQPAELMNCLQAKVTSKSVC